MPISQIQSSSDSKKRDKNLEIKTVWKSDKGIPEVTVFYKKCHSNINQSFVRLRRTYSPAHTVRKKVFPSVFVTI